MRGPWVKFLIFAAYQIEGGLFLVLVPWSSRWPRLFYFQRFPWLKSLGVHPVIRGTISGIGLALLAVGLIEVLRAVLSSREREEVGS